MQYQLPYDYLPPLEIPDKNLVGVFEAGLDKPSVSSTEIITKALYNPIGSPRLPELATQARNALILCDDNTRYTPALSILSTPVSNLPLRRKQQNAMSKLYDWVTNTESLLQAMKAVCHWWGVRI